MCVVSRLVTVYHDEALLQRDDVAFFAFQLRTWQFSAEYKPCSKIIAAWLRRHQCTLSTFSNSLFSLLQSKGEGSFYRQEG
jgi:hypothetical protein